MVAVRIPGAEQIADVAPARDPGVTATPDDFGAQIGTSAAHFGDALSSLGAHLYNKRQAAEDQTAIQTYNVEVAPRLAKAEIDTQKAYPDGGPEYIAASRAAGRGAHDGTLADLRARGLNPSDSAMRHIETSYAGRDMNTRVGAVTYDNNANLEKLKSQNNSNINSLSAQVLAGGDVDEALKQVDEIAAGASQLYGGAALEAWKKTARATVQRAAIEGAIKAKDEPRSRELQRRFFGDGPLPGQSEAEQPAGAVSTARVYDAIYGQESGHGRNTTTSVTGARGGMQIQPGTWALYAKPGENIDNAADNKAVGRRIIDDLSAKSGGDPARIAVGYFSGPGNIAPAGSPTPWKVDKPDPTGKKTSSYVADITRRLGAPETPDTALALEYRNKIDSMAAVNRDDVKASVGDDIASMSATGIGDPTLTADRIAKALGPNAAEDWQTARARAKEFHTQTQDFSTLPPEAMNLRIKSLAAKPGQDEYVAQDALHTAAIKKADAIMETRKKDPAESVSDDPEVKRAIGNYDPKDPSTTKAIITARLAAQQRAGIAAPSPIPLEETQRLLKPINEAVQMEDLDRTKKGDTNRVVLAQQQLVKDLKEKYGPYADKVMREVIGQAANARDRLSLADAAGKVMSALINGTVPGAKPVKIMKITAENNVADKAMSIGAMSDAMWPADAYSYTPAAPPPKIPSPDRIQILINAPANDQARLAGMFDKAYGAGSAQKYLNQKAAPTGTVTVDDSGESYTP